MKICSICKKNLPLNLFDKQKTGKLGRRADCKECRKRFVRSPEGFVKSTYSNQKVKSARRKHPNPSYTEHDLMVWLDNQPNFYDLFVNWVNSNYDEDLRPSIDRLDDYLPYTLDNIRLITKKENVTRFYTDIQQGNNTKRCISVDQYSLDGTFIASHYSYAQAARSVNGLPSNIRNVAEQRPITRKEANGNIRSFIPKNAYGYIWRKP